MMFSLTAFSWRRRDIPGAQAMIVIGLAVTVWSLAYAAEITSPTLDGKLAWAKVEYLGIVALPPAWLAFGVAYTGRAAWWTWPRRLAVSLVPILALGVVWTSPGHDLFWRNVHLGRPAPFSALAFDHGPVFWIYAAFSYLYLLGGTLLILDTVRRTPPAYRSQATSLVIAVCAPWIGNALYLANLTPVPHLDLTPFGFTISGLAAGWAIFRGQLLDVFLGFPLLAEAIVVDSMEDGVVVVDSRGTVVGANPAARSLFPHAQSDLVGQKAATLFPSWPAWLESLNGAATGHADLILGDGDAWREIDVLLSRRGLPGVILVFRDVTERKRVEEEAAARRAEHARLAAILAMTHEAADRLSNSLNGAQGFTQLALQTPEVPVQVHQLLEEAQEGLREAITYVRKLQWMEHVSKQEIRRVAESDPTSNPESIESTEVPSDWNW